MRIQVSKKSLYVPEWRGNRELSEEERIVVRYTNLSFDERRKFQPKRAFRVLIPDVYKAKDKELDSAVDEALSPDGEMTSSPADNPGMVRAMKPTIEHLEVEDGDPITTWEALLKTPVTKENRIDELISELELELPRTQEPPESKNSD